MKYRLVRSLAPNCLLMENDQQQLKLLDHIVFPIPVRDNLRVEMQKELQSIIAGESAVMADGLIKYEALEKVEGELYLVRDAKPEQYFTPFTAEDPELVCKGLLKILNICREYHRQGLVCGGLSSGQLQIDNHGEFRLQDPLVINYLNKSLEECYHYDLAPEVIRGRPWDAAADLFSWGVLAYRLLTGVDPFAAMTVEERMAKIIQIRLIPPRELNPILSPILSELVMGCLERDPQQRLKINTVQVQLTEMVAQRSYAVSDVDAQAYREKAESNRKRLEGVAGFQLWFRKYGVVSLITLGIIIGVSWTFLANPSKSVITMQTKPAAVVSYYFRGVKNLDVQMVQDTLHGAKNSFSDLVTNLYVMNKEQYLYAESTKDNAKIVFPELTVHVIQQTPTVVKYQVNYTLQIVIPKETRNMQRVDEFTLQPFHHIWRIRDIRVIHQKQWTVPNPKWQETAPDNSDSTVHPQSSR